jgi:hypothetical protein
METLQELISYVLCYSFSFLLGMFVGMIFCVWAMRAFSINEYDDV